MTEDHCQKKSRDWLFYISLAWVVTAYFTHFAILTFDFSVSSSLSSHFGSIFEIMNQMWWGVVLGIVFTGLIASMPQEAILSIMGRPGSYQGLLRATMAGVFLDLCSHGILAVGLQLYKKGLSLGQTMAFLIASPWNSLSLTIILTSLIGPAWTLAFILLSVLIALFSGLIFDRLVRNKTLPTNPVQVFSDDIPPIRSAFQNFRISTLKPKKILKDGFSESRIIIKWLLVGTVLASLVRQMLTIEDFQNYFGPSLAGLGLTMVAATVIEVCSEGSVPIASDLLNRAKAPGNSFAFLMGGVSTDYTEVMSIREKMKSWKIALFLPLVTLPQILVLAYLLNRF